ncbi:hypothetical protein V6Z69_12395, partial [Cereibacter sphaeroides]|uniref:hypothetical protein n=1 Tax=Cereibacter sphaeroides TaxID=1063 RepID=UPI0039903BE0
MKTDQNRRRNEGRRLSFRLAAVLHRRELIAECLGHERLRIARRHMVCGAEILAQQAGERGLLAGMYGVQVMNRSTEPLAKSISNNALPQPLGHVRTPGHEASAALRCSEQLIGSSMPKGRMKAVAIDAMLGATTCRARRNAVRRSPHLEPG